jgi:transposase-like protein
VPLLLCVKSRVHDVARRSSGKDPTTTTCLICASSTCAATNTTPVSAVVYRSLCRSSLHSMDPNQLGIEESRRRRQRWWCVACTPSFLPFSSTALSNHACFFSFLFFSSLLMPSSLLFSSLLFSLGIFCLVSSIIIA